MSLLSRIEYQSGFSELEKKIADYLIEHKEDVIHMNLKELAKATYTSTATISRFCKKVEKRILMIFVFICGSNTISIFCDC